MALSRSVSSSGHRSALANSDPGIGIVKQIVLVLVFTSVIAMLKKCVKSVYTLYML